jgi:hypothetical protein
MLAGMPSIWIGLGLIVGGVILIYLATGRT